jgi:hypothetical protein
LGAAWLPLAARLEVFTAGAVAHAPAGGVKRDAVRRRMMKLDLRIEGVLTSFKYRYYMASAPFAQGIRRV